jgi:hypothetical protein
VDFLTFFCSYREVCRQLFDRLAGTSTDLSSRANLAIALRERAFEILLVGLMESMNIPVPANNDVTEPLYSMSLLQAGAFDNFYDNNQTFRTLIGILQSLVQECGGPFLGTVTPDVTPDGTPERNGSGGGKGGGNAGGGGGDAVGGGIVAG